MDSLVLGHASTAMPRAYLPGWALSRGRDVTEADAVFAVGIALKSLNDLVSGESVWADCLRERQALKCAAAAVRLMARNEDEKVLRDAVLRTALDDDPGPA